ncbi:hypothetical protein B0T17DRAFT_5157 [Bombardia bombarda]|uniref:Uncharacterized protein n=1 Tax=Bombardia bombarda TaxID=252184 RepID=A0AA40CDF9_9PEZI|nr:hypothetical protein B0T17DRAFT_5157 [Bombardia bombarda]
MTTFVEHERCKIQSYASALKYRRMETLSRETGLGERILWETGQSTLTICRGQYVSVWFLFLRHFFVSLAGLPKPKIRGIGEYPDSTSNLVYGLLYLLFTFLLTVCYLLPWNILLSVHVHAWDKVWWGRTGNADGALVTKNNGDSAKAGREDTTVWMRGLRCGWWCCSCYRLFFVYNLYSLTPVYMAPRGVGAMEREVGQR